jgi:thioredoxin 1
MIQVKKFYAEWCGPCKMLTPIMEQVKEKFSDISFEDVNIDDQFEVAQKYYVRSVPTVIIEKDGQEVQRFAGLQSELAYTNAINELKNI